VHLDVEPWSSLCAAGASSIATIVRNATPLKRA
jgi:hypothetical protein